MAKPQRTRASHTPINTGSAFRGNHLFERGAKVSTVNPDWDKCAIPSIFQLIPDLWDRDDNGDPQPLEIGPFRDRHDNESDRQPGMGLTNFFYLAAVAKMVGIGDNKQTFIVCDYAAGEDPHESLYGIMFRRISEAVNKNSEDNLPNVLANNRRVNPANWLKYMPGKSVNMKMTAFTHVRKMVQGFFPVLTLVDKGEVYINAKRNVRGANRGDYAQILTASASLTKKIIEQLSIRSDKFYRGELDLQNNYKHGDPTQLDGTGKWMVVYNKEKHHSAASILGQTGVSIDTVNDENEPDLGTSGDDGDDGHYSSYTVDFVDRVRLPFGNTSGNFKNSRFIGEIDTATILSNYRPIIEYIDIPEVDKQKRILTEAFIDRPEMIYYAFADTPDFFTDEVNAMLAARVQVAKPGNTNPEEDDPDFGLSGPDDDDPVFPGGDGDAGMSLDDDEPVMARPSKSPFPVGLHMDDDDDLPTLDDVDDSEFLADTADDSDDSDSSVTATLPEEEDEDVDAVVAKITARRAAAAKAKAAAAAAPPVQLTPPTTKKVIRKVIRTVVKPAEQSTATTATPPATAKRVQPVVNSTTVKRKA